MRPSPHHDDIGSDSIVAAAKSRTIDFENVDTTPNGFAVLEDFHGKLNWENLYVLNGADYGIEYYGNSGYITGKTSGEQVMYNPYFVNDASISLTSGTYTFDSVQMTSAWNLREVVTIKGYDEAGNEIDSTTVKLTDKGPSDVELHWKGVNKVTFFFPDEFKPDPDLPATANNVVFDDLVVSRVKGKSGGADAPHTIVSDGAFGIDSHHESIGAIHHLVDAPHPGLVALA